MISCLTTRKSCLGTYNMWGTRRNQLTLQLSTLISRIRTRRRIGYIKSQFKHRLYNMCTPTWRCWEMLQTWRVMPPRKFSKAFFTFWKSFPPWVSSMRFSVLLEKCKRNSPWTRLPLWPKPQTKWFPFSKRLSKKWNLWRKNLRAKNWWS